MNRRTACIRIRCSAWYGSTVSKLSKLGKPLRQAHSRRSAGVSSPHRQAAGAAPGRQPGTSGSTTDSDQGEEGQPARIWCRQGALQKPPLSGEELQPLKAEKQQRPSALQPPRTLEAQGQGAELNGIGEPERVGRPPIRARTRRIGGGGRR